MKYLIEPYIYPIMDGDETVGQGFASDGYFITAAHVVRDYPMCFINLGKLKVQLSSIKPLYIGKGDIDKDPNQTDVAIYKLGDRDSSLHLSIKAPLSTETYKSCCVHTKFDSSTNEYHKVYTERDATVIGEEGNYFYCRCRRFPSSSGSPLLWGNQVVGIMHGGDPDDELCAFLKIESFIFNTDIQVPYDKIGLAKELLDGEIELMTAKYILYALHYDLGYINAALLEDMTETGLNMCLDSLPFNIYELKEYEKEALIEYCQSLVLKVIDNGED